MKTYKRYAHLTGNLVMVGFGSIGQAVLPLLFRHLDLQPRPGSDRFRCGKRR